MYRSWDVRKGTPKCFKRFRPGVLPLCGIIDGVLNTPEAFIPRFKNWSRCETTHIVLPAVEERRPMKIQDLHRGVATNLQKHVDDRKSAQCAECGSPDAGTGKTPCSNEPSGSY